jgi:hypothetical protein
MTTELNDQSMPGGHRWAAVPVVVALILCAAIYLRYNGAWAEGDTAVLTRAGRAVLDQGTITPDRYAYNNGFAYPTLLAFLASVTGLPIRELQTTVLPWLMVALALMAFAAFRAVTGSARAGAIAASLLLVQPDFLFVVQRGSHEKTTWIYVLALLFALITSLGQRRHGAVAPYVVVFYLCGFALICTNAFFGSSFTTVILLSLLGGYVVSRRFFRVFASKRLLPRLGYVFLVFTALFYVVVFFVYPPAETNLANLGRLVDRMAALYLNVDTKLEERVTTATNVRANADVSTSSRTTSPYAVISLGWTSPQVFFFLTIFTWLMIIATVFAWLVLAVTFVRRGVLHREVPLFLIWAFAATAALQIVASIGSDFAGAATSNLQLRLFPLFTVFAIPLLVSTLTHYRIPPRSKVLRRTAIALGLLLTIVVTNAFPVATIVAIPGVLVALYLLLAWERSQTARRLGSALGVVAFVYFALAAVLKATSDPLVSNKWFFYSGAEARGLRWGDEHLTRTYVWDDFDERLGAASILLVPDSPLIPLRAFWTRSRDETVRYRFVSDITADRATRVRGVLPDVRGDDRIYDNGTVQITHRVPHTPYQP